MYRVYFNEDTGITIVWNGSSLFDVYRGPIEINSFIRVGVLTVEEAEDIAKNWAEKS